MSHFRVPMEITDGSGQGFERVEAMVDTGATYTWVPTSILQRLGHQPEEQWEFELADGRKITYGVKWVTVRVNGSSHPTPVVFGEEGTEPLLGVVTLEESRLGVDAVNERLIPTPPRLGGPRRL